jgi:hypothetical protein
LVGSPSPRCQYETTQPHIRCNCCISSLTHGNVAGSVVCTMAATVGLPTLRVVRLPHVPTNPAK